MYYLGYHLLPEGKSLIYKLKSRMNNYRLSTNQINKNEVNTDNLEIEINNVFSMPAPYEIKNGIRVPPPPSRGGNSDTVWPVRLRLSPYTARYGNRLVPKQVR